eukprot:CAMPEP_0167768268 /NCGR_PEP_ID=MMETSP0110_2-20121227/16543_1 /TAXON_ID=629695 /ORGANISM="Gymnochlora sp., Strain CCMP2014" /LENGTH=156 /DNA_ID=CAMNT_0007656863 /DNA_START=158 /DNA_END=625 /DNA_ORIENTATION=-
MCQEVFEKAFAEAESFRGTEEWMAQRYDYLNKATSIALTGCEEKTLQIASTALTTIPEKFTLHSQLKKIIAQKKQTLDAGENIDWGTAEGLAFATLLLEGVHVRLSGQDSERGTFSHRHAVLHDQKTGERYMPLNNITPDQSAFASIVSSPLSEFG